MLFFYFIFKLVNKQAKKSTVIVEQIKNTNNKSVNKKPSKNPKKITPENKIEAGRNVFAIACSRCHTAQGVNSVVYVFERMYGVGKPLDINSMASYIPNMHNGRTYMPPFPGTQEESEALAAYIRNIQDTGDVLEGAQSEGVKVSELQNTQAVLTIKK